MKRIVLLIIVLMSVFFCFSANVQWQAEALAANYALDFDGSNDYVEVGDADSLDVTDNFTVEAWIYVENFKFLAGIAVKYHGGGGGFVFRLSQSAPYNRIDFCAVTGGIALSTGTWYHVAGVMNSETASIYIDGKLDRSGSPGYTLSANSDPVTIGMDYGPHPRYFDGVIDEVRIWNTARTQSDITANMNELTGNKSGLVAYYKMSNGSGTTLSDNSGNNHNGTISGATWVTSTAPIGGGVEIIEPAITCLSPSEGLTSGGTEVTISGYKFGSERGTGSVTFGGVEVTIISWSDTEIVCTTPAHAAGGAYVVVTTSDGSSDTSAFVYSEAGGDVNGDGKVTAYDAVLTLKHVIGLEEIPAEKHDIADVSGNGKITAYDAALILQYSVGIITAFPREQPNIAPTFEPKSEDESLIEAIEQLETISLNGEQRKVFEQLKRLVSERLLPKHTSLLQNYPNPFNPDTWLPYQLATDAPVTISIYNTKGQLVRQLDIGKQKAGSYLDKKNASYWNGKDQLGQSVSSGLYFYMLKAGSFMATRRMVILK